MLHLRLICPSERTDEVGELLDRSVGVAHTCGDPRRGGSAARGTWSRRTSPGNAPTRCSPGSTALSLDHDGAITLESLDTVLSDAADAAEEAAPGEGVDAVVWDELIARTGEDSRLTVELTRSS